MTRSDTDGEKAKTEHPGDADGKPKKERVLHTRVPAVLERELKRLAGSLRVPVSNVVRTILEDAVTAVDSVGRVAEDELRDVADRFRHRRGQPQDEKPNSSVIVVEEPKPAPLAGIVGYQPLLLASEQACSLCGRGITAGESAYLGIRDGAGPRVILGKECLPFSAANEPGPPQANHPKPTEDPTELE